MKVSNSKKFFLVTIVITVVSGCSIGDWFKSPDDEASAAKIYKTAYISLQKGSYATALEKYEELEQKYPFNKYTRRAILESAYANYKHDESEKTIALTDRFIKNYPGDPNMDYAYYLKGLAYFNRGKTLLHYVFPRDMSAKSSESLLMAFDTFSELYNKFPNSIYRTDTKTRLIALRNMLAIHEIRIASFYLKKGSYIAAINRIKYMLEKYEGAQHTADGLYLMATAYERIGSHDLARDTLRVLKLNYPDMLDENMNYVMRGETGDQQGWFENLQDMSDVILEKLRIKPRY